MSGCKHIIDTSRIEDLIVNTERPADGVVREIVGRALKIKGLSIEDVATLIASAADQSDEIFKAAREVKNSIYGKRIVLFAPLYLSNDCINDCLYCGFRKSNGEMARRTLTMDEIERETKALLADGHKRLLVVASENGPGSEISYLEDAIRAIYGTKFGKERIRRVNVNVAPMGADEFGRLKKSGIGTYQIFQETYHPETYAKMHPAGPKSDYDGRLRTPDLAMKAGIDDVGIGALFGLHDWRFELLALMQHVSHLEKIFGVGPHTISVPRIEPASNAPAALAPPSPVSDDDFKRIVAILRLAVPYTGIILSTRESGPFRDEVIGLGVSQISTGSRTDPGGYSSGVRGCGQFSVSDNRNQAEMIEALIKHGHLPSFCTACYRSGRTGESFMHLAKPGEIKNLCGPNCLITFREYLIDHADWQMQRRGEEIIKEALANIPDELMRRKTEDAIARIESGERDVYL